MIGVKREERVGREGAAKITKPLSSGRDDSPGELITLAPQPVRHELRLESTASTRCCSCNLAPTRRAVPRRAAALAGPGEAWGTDTPTPTKIVPPSRLVRHSSLQDYGAILSRHKTNSSDGRVSHVIQGVDSRWARFRSLAPRFTVQSRACLTDEPRPLGDRL